MLKRRKSNIIEQVKKVVTKSLSQIWIGGKRMKEKREQKKESLWKLLMPGIVVYAILIILVGGVMIINQYMPTTLLPNIIAIAIILSGLFYLWLRCCKKPKRKMIQYMSIEIIGMLCIITYSAFATGVAQEKMAVVMFLIYLLFYGYVLWQDAKQKKRK